MNPNYFDPGYPAAVRLLMTFAIATFWIGFAKGSGCTPSQAQVHSFLSSWPLAMIYLVTTSVLARRIPRKPRLQMIHDVMAGVPLVAVVCWIAVSTGK